jgi:hypothetical protein
VQEGTPASQHEGASEWIFSDVVGGDAALHGLAVGRLLGIGVGNGGVVF